MGEAKDWISVREEHGLWWVTLAGEPPLPIGDYLIAAEANKVAARWIYAIHNVIAFTTHELEANLAAARESRDAAALPGVIDPSAPSDAEAARKPLAGFAKGMFEIRGDFDAPMELVEAAEIVEQRLAEEEEEYRGQPQRNLPARVVAINETPHPDYRDFYRRQKATRWVPAAATST